MRLGAEAIRVAQALGFKLEPIRGLVAEQWLAAARGDEAALAEVEATMLKYNKRRTGEGRSGTAQDIAKGRRTEIDHMNGYVAAQGEAVGIQAPTHAAVTALVKRIERGELAPSRTLVEVL